jgi:hypothetical protein
VLAYLRFRWELYNLESEQRRIGRINNEALAKAKRAGKPSDDLYAIEEEGASDYFHFQDEIQRLHSRYLVQEARRLVIPCPDLADTTIWDKDGNRVFLTEKGINHMRGPCGRRRKLKWSYLSCGCRVSSASLAH